MRRNTNQVEIQEPPIEELKKKKYCLSKTCVGCCGCFVILIFGYLLALKFASNPRTKELKELPADFTKNIPIYDEKNINKIEFLSGNKRFQLIKKNNKQDTYRLEWQKLPAQPSFIQNYYKIELKKKNFTIDISSGNEIINQFTFKKDDTSGVLYIKDDLIAEGTDYVLLIINMPTKKL